ncbi:MAG: NAD(P)/FAD-dependent oxidoreductase [Phycisphaerales bacterium]
MTEPAPHHVVIVGGGFAGLWCARGLSRAACRVTLVDRYNYHLFQPLLYQVATAVLSPSDIGFPIRRVFRAIPGVTVLLGDVEGIDVNARTLRVSGNHTLPYQTLVLAAGATNAYFGHPEWAEHAPSLKTMDDAVAVRSRILAAFERAEAERDSVRQRRLLTFVIVGGGPTGVELAGAIKELAVDSMVRDFRRFDPGTARVVLVEGGGRLLPAMHPTLSAKAARTLERMGVEVKVDSLVDHIDDQGVRLAARAGRPAERIDAANVLWAAGVSASPLGAMLGAPLDSAGRVHVQGDLTVPGHPDVLVLGDMALLERPGGAGPVPGIAPAAIQMGQYAARLIRARLKGRPAPPPFHYLDKGTLATIGRARAVGEVAGIRVSGLTAWVLWSVVHIAYLVGFRNRLITMLNWIFTYLFFSKGSRLITGAAAREARC